ncbi:FAD/NAD(P)-binding domain-containing protein [Dichomitus squalens]|uniref:FAD/NAD(P)-binding domain-containing protein n=1 Tax=Dichomitus squalens TaxID=114155 RepID=A0A4Q9MHT3_9APHY|nr:FAD/NAD(P)-binding domain-containing protein [Dichomitus squalens]
MVHLTLLISSLLPLLALGHAYDSEQTVLSSSASGRPAKSIAIVGAGSGGLAILKTIFDLPEDVRRDWEVVLYEQRRNVGGVWLPDPPGALPRYPELPESPTYPLLHTNTPHPTMTYIGFPYPPNTPLFPTWDHVQQYHAAYAEHHNVSQYIHARHRVAAANWIGSAKGGEWEVEVHVQDPERHTDVDEPVRIFKKSFDHLVVANGHNHYPNIPQWDGTDEWLVNTPAGTPQREIIHSIYYRRPERYAGRTVVIVGAGASGRDAALQVGKLARVTYQSLRPGNDPTPGAKVVPKPPIAHFNRTSVVFEDGSALHDVDALILGTGYEFRVPFLSPPHSSVLAVDKHTTLNSTTARTLVTNLRYIFPTHRHIFALHPDIPPTALAFIGLPVLVANCPSDIAQSLLVAHAIANASILPPREQLINELVAREDKLRAEGLDPYYVGHRLVAEAESDHEYQDAVVQYLKDVGALPEDGKKFVEPWRRIGRDNSRLLGRAWERVKERREENKWLEGVRTEDEWADLMSRLTEWQRAYEEEHGVPELEGQSVWYL